MRIITLGPTTRHRKKRSRGKKGGKTRAGSKTMEMESENQNIKIKQEVTKQQIITIMAVSM